MSKVQTREMKNFLCKFCNNAIIFAVHVHNLYLDSQTLAVQAVHGSMKSFFERNKPVESSWQFFGDMLVLAWWGGMGVSAITLILIR